MKTETQDLIQIKKTKSISMSANSQVFRIDYFAVEDGGDPQDWRNIEIPLSKVFQVKRGLESCVQRFYRRKK
jgi:hypothetical protein